MHVLSSNQYRPEDLDKLFAKASEFKKLLADPKAKKQLSNRYQSAKMCNLFYEPSTRTRLSFGFAANCLGILVQDTENAREFSSAAKGETIEDTIKVINQYGVDIIVLRHYETGSVARAAEVSQASVVNAGDGKGEHPTQALLDTYTIHENHGRLDNLKVVMGGDLKHGRTVRSLSKMLAKYPNNQITFVSTPDLQMGDDILAELDKAGTAYTQTDDIKSAVKDADVVYWTRLQKERLENPESIDEGDFVITPEIAGSMPKSAIIMHPLPRVDEIAVEVDTDPRAKYFDQAGNGLYVRMAIIDTIMSARLSDTQIA